MRDRLKPNPIADGLVTLMAAVLAYCTAVWANFGITVMTDRAIDALPDTFQAPELHVALFGILLLIVIVALAIPFFQRDWDAPVRKFSLFATVFVGAYVVLHAAGPVDPDIPLHLLVKYVVNPLRLATGHYA